ncbi:hypothetical protein D4764_03G0012590 [Takifugu flavidus]|uniref:Uncharacterized protein n=1 Tax=Takifugu flavidus TaxID=433684 RepID=A0A5C6NCR0_9TELE|nr:hypothetical protein D4764_03G0012590 [Takifugu flavidus]
MPARVLTGIDKGDHITPVLASLHWLPVKFRIIFKILLLTYKVLRGLAHHPNRPLHSQNAGLLVVPRVSSECRDCQTCRLTESKGKKCWCLILHRGQARL